MAFPDLTRQRDHKLWFKLNGAMRFAMARAPLAGLLDAVVVNEYPKSGGTWLGQLLGEATGRTFPRNRLPAPGRNILHGHSMSAAGMGKPVIVWRDGRDVMVSLYHHMILGHSRSSGSNREKMRHVLNAKDPEDVTANLARFIELSFDNKLYPTFSWAEFVDRWHDYPGSIETSYEALQHSPADVLRSVIGDLGEAVPDDEDLQRCIDKFDFARQTGRKAGEEKANQYLRKGIVGDWQNVFDAKAKDVFRQAAGRQLISLGYEKDDEWSQQPDG